MGFMVQSALEASTMINPAGLRLEEREKRLKAGIKEKELHAAFRDIYPDL
jgi:hypothetical protein